MGKYLFAYTGGKVPESEAEQQAQMAAWMGWFEKLGGATVDAGNPFAGSTKVSAGGVANGGSCQLTGYSIVSAGDLNAASDLAKSCPILANGGNVEVYETLDVM